MRSRDTAARNIEDMSAAIDALYVFASEPDNWQEMTDLLADFAGRDQTEEYDTLLSSLKDHTRRAETLAQRLHAPEDTPPALPAGLAGFDRLGRVTGLTEPARETLAHYCAQGPTAGALPDFHDPENARSLVRALRELAKGPGSAPALFRLADADGRDRVVGMTVAPAAAPPKVYETFEQTVPAQHHANTRMILIVPQRHAATEDPDAYRRLLGLSPAESRLAAELQTGSTLKEAAASLGISINTARNQLHSVFEKIGVNRQSDLIRHLSDMMALGTLMDTSVREGGAVGHAGQPAPEVMRLPCGRRLAYREFGNPAGHPVVILPSSLRSSLGWPPETTAAEDLGIRLIIVERPGIGRSDPDPSMTLESIAADIAALADHLGLSRFALSGRSSGTPFTLAAAAHLGDRITRVLLASPRFGVPHGHGNSQSMLSYCFNGLRRHPWLLRSSASILKAKISAPIMRQLTLHFFERSPIDVAYLKRDTELMENSVVAAVESFWHSHEGLFQEAQLFLDGIDLDLSGLTAPVEIWHGSEDRIITPDETRAHLERLGLRPDRMEEVPGEGHFFVTYHYRALLEAAIRTP